MTDHEYEALDRLIGKRHVELTRHHDALTSKRLGIQDDEACVRALEMELEAVEAVYKQHDTERHETQLRANPEHDLPAQSAPA